MAQVWARVEEGVGTRADFFRLQIYKFFGGSLQFSLSRDRDQYPWHLLLILSFSGELLSHRSTPFEPPASVFTASQAKMMKLPYSLAVVCLICISITSSLPGCLSVRPFPADKDAVIGVTVEPTMDDLNPDSDSDSTLTSTSFSEVDQFSVAEEEDLTAHPCYAILAKARSEGRTDAATTDEDIPVVEVDCRRMLVDYSEPKTNSNPKCASTKRC